MARIKLVELEETTGAEKECYGELTGHNAVINVRKGLLNDTVTYDVCMDWYTSWQRLVKVASEKDAILYAHTISATNLCQLYSLLLISDTKGLGLDPANLNYDEREETLTGLGRSVIKGLTAVSDEPFEKLRTSFDGKEIVVIVGSVGQMTATNNSNSVLQIGVGKRLFPIIDEFGPATWRDNLKKQIFAMVAIH